MSRRHLRRVAVGGLAGLLLSLAIGCTDEQPDRQQSSTADANSQDASRDARPSSPATQPQPDKAATAEDVARAAAPSAALQPQTVDWSGGDPGEGHEVYEMYCLLCHGPDGKGQGPGAAALDPKPRDFTTGRFYIDANANNQTGEDVDLARVIRDGAGAFGGSSAMPGWKSTFSEAQVRDVVAYVRQLSQGSQSRGG